MKGRGQCYETYCDFSKSSYHQQADGKNKNQAPCSGGNSTVRHNNTKYFIAIYNNFLFPKTRAPIKKCVSTD
jgi:hypothetical protein